MPASRPLIRAAFATALLVVAAPAFAQVQPTTIVATNAASLRTWDSTVDAMLRAGDLEVRRTDEDTLVEGRTHTRLQQFYKGVPVLGAELTRQTDELGATISIFGETYAGLNLDVTPTLTLPSVVQSLADLSGVELGPTALPTLVIAPTEDGFKLAWRASVFTTEGGTAYLIDAHDGTVLQTVDAVQRQSAVGSGTGVLGDAKKMSVTSDAGTFTARDPLRPPLLTTYDARENLQRVVDFLNGRVSFDVADRASDSDNVWTDAATVDAHAYTGYFYDFYFKRFGRRGLDDANFRLLSIVHPVNRAAVLSQTNSTIGLFYLNAFYAGSGVMVYGEGLPSTVRANSPVGPQNWNYLSGALDVVAHELTHGVTDYSSKLIYQNESGALNESFSDMMGTAAEFFYQTPGSGQMRADYLIAEDVITPGGLRSMDNPAQFNQPDHYSKRSILPVTSDNGGVHVNSGIPNHAYYLAIEGGTNRTSGLSVQGVGVTNREQIEKAMYRGFTQMMPANATFSVARAVTIQAATDLYGSTSAAVRALTQAWTAVGVN